MLLLLLLLVLPRPHLRLRLPPRLPAAVLLVRCPSSGQGRWIADPSQSTINCALNFEPCKRTDRLQARERTIRDRKRTHAKEEGNR